LRISSSLSCSDTTVARSLGRLKRVPVCPRQCGKIHDRQLFGARGWVKPGCTDWYLRLWNERFQALSQHFAPLAECGRGHLFQVTQLRRRDRLMQRFDPDDGRGDFGRRRERARAYVKKNARARAPLRKNGEPAVV